MLINIIKLPPRSWRQAFTLFVNHIHFREMRLCLNNDALDLVIEINNYFWHTRRTFQLEIWFWWSVDKNFFDIMCTGNRYCNILIVERIGGSWCRLDVNSLYNDGLFFFKKKIKHNHTPDLNSLQAVTRCKWICNSWIAWGFSVRQIRQSCVFTNHSEWSVLHHYHFSKNWH